MIVLALVLVLLGVQVAAIVALSVVAASGGAGAVVAVLAAFVSGVMAGVSLISWLNARKD